MFKFATSVLDIEQTQVDLLGNYFSKISSQLSSWYTMWYIHLHHWKHMKNMNNYNISFGNKNGKSI